MRTAPFLETRLDELLDSIAAETPAPGGGSVSAIATAMAAALIAMAARFSKAHWPGSVDAVGQAEQLRAHVGPLAQADALAYEEVLTAFRLPKDLEPEVRNQTIGGALSRAADVPLAIAECAADIAELGAAVAEHGNPNLRGDAVSGTILAAGAARSSANLVVVNLGSTASDERVVRARQLVDAAEEAVRRALAAGT